jgi:hypothetical protein
MGKGNPAGSGVLRKDHFGLHAMHSVPVHCARCIVHCALPAQQLTTLTDSTWNMQWSVCIGFDAELPDLIRCHLVAAVRVPLAVLPAGTAVLAVVL